MLKIKDVIKEVEWIPQQRSVLERFNQSSFYQRNDSIMKTVQPCLPIHSKNQGIVKDICSSQFSMILWV